MGIVLLATALALTTQGAAAQSMQSPGSDPMRNERRGFWIGFGLGGDSSGIDCFSCSTDRTSGQSGHLRLGGTLSQSVQLGVETNDWINSDQGVDESLAFGKGSATTSAWDATSRSRGS